VLHGIVRSQRRAEHATAVSVKRNPMCLDVTDLFRFDTGAGARFGLSVEMRFRVEQGRFEQGRFEHGHVE